MNARGQYGASNGYRSLRGAHGAYGLGSAQRSSVGQLGGFTHSRAEFEAALEKIMTDFATLVNEVLTRMGGDPADFAWNEGKAAEMARDPAGYAAKLQRADATIRKSPLFTFYNTYLKPLYSSWLEFYRDPMTLLDALSGGLFSVGLAWDKMVQWQNRLRDARAATDKMLAKTGQTALESPDPTPLPTSIVERSAAGVEEAAKGVTGAFGDIGTVLKWVVIGALGVGGAVAVSSLASRLKKGRS